MANTRLVSAIAAAGVIAAGISAAAAWAGGPGGAVEPDTYAAVGTGVYSAGIVGFQATGATSEEVSAGVMSQCQAAGLSDCTVDEYTNDNLCIVSVADASRVVSGGAGPTVEAARLDALARAAANGTPEDPGAVVVVSSCP